MILAVGIGPSTNVQSGRDCTATCRAKSGRGCGFVAVPAPFGRDATPAFRPACLADVPPVQDQPVMGIAQPFGRDPLEQPILHLPRGLSRRQAGAVTQPEDVGVDRHGALTEGNVQHHVRGLAPDPRQSFQRRRGPPAPGRRAVLQLARQSCTTLRALVCHSPIERMWDATPSTPRSIIALGVGATLNRVSVALLTDRSVAWADSTTATSKVNGSAKAQFGFRCRIMGGKSLDEAAHLGPGHQFYGGVLL